MLMQLVDSEDKPMPDDHNQEPREITDEMLLSELTVGEFKQLVRDLLAESGSRTKQPARPEPHIEQVTVRRKSLDEFMSDLGGKK